MIKVYPKFALDVLRANTWAPFGPYEAFFQKNGLEYSQEAGDSALIMHGDDNALLAANETKFYPYDMVAQLLRKDTLPHFMSLAGFRELRTERVRSVDEAAGMTNFIVKPILGANGRGLTWMGDPPDFLYQRCASVDDLLRGRTVDAVNAVLADGNYCLQTAVMSEDFEQVTISGTVNGSGEVYFRRNARWVWQVNVLTHQERERAKYEAERTLLADMLRDVRNAAFGVQFMVIDGALFPIDWNFRDPGRTVKVEWELNPAEFEQALAHQFDVPHEKVLATDLWETVCNDDFDKAEHTIRAV